jgi:hypothetical protein
MAAYSLETANICVYAHSRAAGDGKYGQNIGYGALPEDVPFLITNMMYNDEIELYQWYGSEPPPMTDSGTEWGHYTQIVWKDTTEVGCATVNCSGFNNAPDDVRPFFTVCDYYPVGTSQEPMTFYRV